MRRKSRGKQSILDFGFRISDFFKVVTSYRFGPACTQIFNPKSKICNPSLSLRPKKNEQMTNRTFTMIKPDATAKGNTGAILQMINAAGFRIVAMKMTQLSIEKAGEFYAVHAERPFYGELVEFMSRGPITAAILEKENAVEDFRKLIGATNPANAEDGTIRKLYAASVGENAVHGSDSDENAALEGDFFFSKLEQF
jgi:nucleoside-diphosphate kinase